MSFMIPLFFLGLLSTSAQVLLNRWTGDFGFFDINLLFVTVMSLAVCRVSESYEFRLTKGLLIGLWVGFLQDSMSASDLGPSMFALGLVGILASTMIRDAIEWGEGVDSVALVFFAFGSGFLIFLMHVMWGPLSLSSMTWSSWGLSSALQASALMLCTRVWVR